MNSWRFCADSGGTFTDCLAVDPAGLLHRAKVLSSGRLRARVAAAAPPDRLTLDHPYELADDFLAGFELRVLGTKDRVDGVKIAGYEAASRTVRLATHLPSGELVGMDVELATGEEAPVVGARLVTGTPPGEPLPPMEARLGTTRGTNALLERTGQAVALFVTRGFRDLLAIGDQRRPDLFALEIVKRPLLYRAVVEVDERLDPEGNVERPPDLESLSDVARGLLEKGIDAAAVAFLHSYRNPAHEQAVAAHLLELGFRHVSTSSRLSPHIKIVPRAETAVVNAYLERVLGTYTQRVVEGLAPRTLHLMTSAAGLVRAESFEPKDSLLSGPAGGVLGAVAAAVHSGAERLLAFDMGGTSTDVSHWDGELEYRRETEVGQARLLSPSLAVETVAAGGGSICSFDGRQLKVGPESSGSRPGPACYGAGGPLSVTDVNLLLGRIDPGRFAFPVDVEVAKREAARLRTEVASASGRDLTVEELLAGFLRIANEKMAGAVRRSSVRKGFRPSDHWLVAFGGAGPQHACELADLLGVRRVHVPPDAALLSASGLMAARIERFAERQVLSPFDEVEPRFQELFTDLRDEALAKLADEGVDGSRAELLRRTAFLRFAGQEGSIEVPVQAAPGPDGVTAAFSERYRSLFGYEPADRPVEVESLRVVVAESVESVGAPDEPYGLSSRSAAGSLGGVPAAGPATRRIYFSGGWTDAPVVERRNVGRLSRKERIAGPALVVEAHTVAVVEPGWAASLDETGALILDRQDDSDRAGDGKDADAGSDGDGGDAEIRTDG